MKTYIKFIGTLMLAMAVFGCSKDDNTTVIPDPVQESPSAGLQLAISKIDPIKGPEGTIINISMENLVEIPDEYQVFFNELEATTHGIENEIILAQVPAKANTGTVKVIIDGKTIIGPEFFYEPTTRISTLAGSSKGFIDGTGGQVWFNHPRSMAVGPQGNLYVADTENNRIRKITPEGKTTTFAGHTKGYVDGNVSIARFNYPNGVAVDEHGNVYVADSGNYRIRKISPEGEVTTLAGSTSGDTDGAAHNAKFGYPIGIAVNTLGEVYVSDSETNKIRKISPTGYVSTFAGSTEGHEDGTATNAKFDYPYGIALDIVGNLYVADNESHKIRKITPDGIVSTIAGGEEGFADGNGDQAQFRSPSAVSADAEGNIYVADTENNKIRKISPDGEVNTPAGTTKGARNGTAELAQFNNPYGVLIDPQNTIYVADSGNHRIRKITNE